MTADPWDLPTITHQPPLTPDEVEAIAGEIREHQWSDAALMPDLYRLGFEALSRAGVAGDVDATQAVRRMLQRARFGGPLEDMPRGEFV
jgi:hypothetical protein